MITANPLLNCVYDGLAHLRPKYGLFLFNDVVTIVLASDEFRSQVELFTKDGQIVFDFYDEITTFDPCDPEMLNLLEAAAIEALTPR